MLSLTDTSLHNRLAPYLVDDLLSTTDLPEPLMDELKGEQEDLPLWERIMAWHQGPPTPRG